MYLYDGAFKVIAGHPPPPRRSLPASEARRTTAAKLAVDREPGAEALRQGGSLSTILHNIQNLVDEDDVWNPRVPVLNRQEGVVLS